jgi:hypothetical protein
MLELAELQMAALDHRVENIVTESMPSVETTRSTRLHARWIRSSDGRLQMRWELDPSPERYRPGADHDPVV